MLNVIRAYFSQKQWLRILMYSNTNIYIDGQWYLYMYRLLSFQNNRPIARSMFQSEYSFSVTFVCVYTKCASATKKYYHKILNVRCFHLIKNVKVASRGLGDTTPCTVNWCKKSPIWGAWLASSYVWAFRISLSFNKIHP